MVIRLIRFTSLGTNRKGKLMKADDPIIETGRTAVHPLDTKLGRVARGCALTIAFFLMVAALLIVLYVIGAGGLVSIASIFLVGFACAMAGCAVALAKCSGPL